LVDIIEYWICEGKFYFCVVKDVYFNWIVGYFIDLWMMFWIVVVVFDNVVV